MSIKKTNNKLLLAYYGDDFTGSTDALEALALNGIPTALFLEPPSADTIKNFRLKRNISGAGDGTLKAHLYSIIKFALRSIHHLRWENFGRAAEIARDLAGSKIIPVLIGTPLLKRFVVFGNLFATVDNETFRIDRHPTMSRHPITPMDEGDMRYHLAKQTKIPVYSFDLLHQQGSDDVVDLRYKNLTKELLDTSENASLTSQYLQNQGYNNQYQQARITIAFPLSNICSNLTIVAAMVGGNLFDLGEVTGIRLEAVHLPAELRYKFALPVYDIDGFREILAHPSGPEAGVASLIQGWQATNTNIALEEYSKNNRELSEALEFFGQNSSLEERGLS